MSNIKEKRAERTRGKIRGTKSVPRLSVYRSNKQTYAQLIDDEKGVSLASASTKSIKKGKTKQNGMEKAELLGEELGKKAKKKGIKKAVFDRGQYRYHGKVKAVAEGARKGGLKL